MAQIIPDDVVWARGARFHLQALLACAGIIVLAGILAVAVVLMAGPLAGDPPIRVGLLALGIGALCALAGAVLAGVGQFRVLTAPQEGEPSALEKVETILTGTSASFAILPRVAIAGCVALIAGTSLWVPSGFWGAIVGAFVVIQVALLLTVVRKVVLSTQRLHRTV